MSSARILVYGAGPLGSLFAAKLQRAGHDVSLLARGQRLADLREHGIVLVDFMRKERTTTQVNVVESLQPGDAYDLILVIMRKNHALQILPVLAANTATPTVLFLMNNAAGQDELVDALGADRVMVGFPSAAGARRGHEMIVLCGTEEEPYPVPIGEVDGSITARTREVAGILSTPVEFNAQIREDMDTWLKCHVGFLMPALGPAMYACGADNYRMARTPDAILLAIRGIRESLRSLRALGYTIVPRYLRVLAALPEPIVYFVLRKALQGEHMEIAMAAHAEAARDEVQHLTAEFKRLTASSGVRTPVCDQLSTYLYDESARMPEGQSNVRMRWEELLLPVLAIAALIIALAILL